MIVMLCSASSDCVTHSVPTLLSRRTILLVSYASGQRSYAMGSGATSEVLTALQSVHEGRSQQCKSSMACSGVRQLVFPQRVHPAEAVA